MPDNLLKPVVRGYSFNVAKALGFQGAPRGKVYFGVELELDIDGVDEDRYEEPKLEDYIDVCYHNDYRTCCDPCRKYYEPQFQRDLKLWKDQISLYKHPLETMPNFVLLKEDGTVDGIEIVSAPASLRIHRNKWKKFFANLPKAYHANENCGMHVHLTRSVLSVEQQWAINEFINSDENEEWVIDLAGRDFVDNNYCGKKRKTREEMREAFDSHHEAVSVSRKNTLEIRIFASTTKYTEFMLRLEFVAALVHFVQSEKWSDTDLTPMKLCNFLRAHTLTYPVLWDYIKVR